MQHVLLHTGRLAMFYSPCSIYYTSICYMTVQLLRLRSFAQVICHTPNMAVDLPILLLYSTWYKQNKYSRGGCIIGHTGLWLFRISKCLMDTVSPYLSTVSIYLSFEYWRTHPEFPLWGDEDFSSGMLMLCDIDLHPCDHVSWSGSLPHGQERHLIIHTSCVWQLWHAHALKISSVKHNKPLTVVTQKKLYSTWTLSFISNTCRASSPKVKGISDWRMDAKTRQTLPLGSLGSSSAAPWAADRQKAPASAAVGAALQM